MSTPPPSQRPDIPAYGAPYTPPPVSTASTPSSTARLMSAIGGGVLALLLMVLASGLSGRAMRRMQVYDLSIQATIPVILFGLGAVVVAVLLGWMIKISSAGAYVGGAVLLLIGLVAIASPQAVFRLTMMMRRLLMGMDYFLLTGAPIVIGAVLIGAGLAGSMIRSSAARR